MRGEFFTVGCDAAKLFNAGKETRGDIAVATVVLIVMVIPIK